jgi:hypothetical protein
MDNAALAQSFNKSSSALNQQGHLIVVRRARALVEAANITAAAAFLDEAATLGSLPDARDLATSLRSWQAAGGLASALCAEPLWDAGGTHDAYLSEQLRQATSGDLSEMMGELVRQQRAVNAGEALPPAPEPSSATAHTLGSIFGESEPSKPAAVVEAETHLKPLSLDLEEPKDSAAEAMNQAVKAIAQETPAPELVLPGLPTPPPSAIDAAADMASAMGASDLAIPDLTIPDVVTQGVVHDVPPSELTGGIDFDAVPELEAPPSIPVAPTQVGKTEESNLGVIIVGALLAAGVAAAIWFLTK